MDEIISSTFVINGYWIKGYFTLKYSKFKRKLLDYPPPPPKKKPYIGIWYSTESIKKKELKENNFDLKNKFYDWKWGIFQQCIDANFFYNRNTF